MPTLRNHTHCQVAQKSQRINQNLPKSMAAPAHWQTAKIKPRKPNKVSYVIGQTVVNCNMITFNKYISGLKVHRVEMPNATYTNRYAKL